MRGSTRRLGVGGLALSFAAGALAVTAIEARADAPLCGGRSATIVGTSGNDRLLGTSGADVIVGRGGRDGIWGYGGNDIICSGGGFDVVVGGDGSDYVRSGPDGDYVVVGTGDSVWSGEGADLLYDEGGDASAIVHAGAGTDHIGLTMATGGSVHAGAGDEEVGVETAPGAQLSLTGGAGVNEVVLHIDDSEQSVPVLLDRAAGVMRLGGSEGEFGGWAAVTTFGDHRWTYRGTDAPDRVYFDDGPVDARLFGGHDEVLANGDRQDYLDGGDGWDRLDAYGGDDHLVGGPGFDTLFGGNGWDYGDDPIPPNNFCHVEDGPCVESETP